MDRSAVIDIIIACTEDYRGTGPIAGGDRIGPSTRLFGPQGVLDSIGLVSVVVAVEQRIRDEHQIDISLMDDRAVSQAHSPFRTPETLADYVLGLQAGPRGDMVQPRIVLITGTRKGIGRHLAEHFVQAGDRVIGCSREAPDWRLEGYDHVLADVTDERQVIALLDEVRRRQGRLDVVINNAGIASMNHLLLTPGATIERIMRTNFVGAALVCREGAKLMIKRGGGRIVNLSTIAVPMRLEGEAVYAASKSALETLTRVLAHELGRWAITVNALGPTPTETDLIRAVPRDKIDGIVARLAIKRLATFEDIAHAIDFFVHPASGYITGQTLYLGGA